MDRSHDNIERLLHDLGRAHREGAFEVGSRSAYPWRTDGPGTRGLTHRRFAWVRAGVPLAAAAAVAVLFIGPVLFDRSSGSHLAEMDSAGMTVPDPQSLVMHVDAATTASSAGLDCDYNRDGRVDGKDIQAMVNRLAEFEGDPVQAAETLQRCLLGG